MLDVDTFLTALYVIADDFRQSRRPKKRPGPDASLSESEVIALAVFARWPRFASERDFYRYAETDLLDAFPTLPTRPSPTASCAPVRDSSSRSSCTWRPSLGRGSAPTRRSIARRCPPGTASAGARGGWPSTPTSVGPTPSDGMKASAYSPPRIPPGSSLASVSGPPPAPTSDWRRPSSP